MIEITFEGILEFIGTFAFAVSGIRLASEKQFDWFGAYVVGLATAIGGGTIRDVMLGQPPFWMINSIDLVFTALALVFVIIYGKKLNKLAGTLFLFDTIGLALFTVVGVEKTLSLHYPIWIAIIMGSMTGAAGGVLRDILINEVPLIFRKEIYAMACVVGGAVFGICVWAGLHTIATELISGLCVIIVRVLAAKYHLSLPVLKDEEEDNNEDKEH